MSAVGSTEAPRRRTVENGLISALSVSQLKTASRCLSAWYFEKVKQLPGKQFKALDTGLKVHGEHEAHLLTGVDALGDIARSGKVYNPLPLDAAERAAFETRAGRPWFDALGGGWVNPGVAPPAGAGLLIEYRFDGMPKRAPFNPATAKLRAAGIPLDGYIDVVNLRMLDAGGRAYPGGMPDPAGTIELLDHKTTSSIEKWGATEAQLASVEFEHGIQMIGYAEWARLTFPQASRFRLTHVDYQTGRARAAKRISAVVDVDHVRESWHKLDILAAKMAEAALCTDPESVPRNESACTAYGGCPYQTVCPAWTTQRARREVDMSILDDLGITDTVAAPAASVPAQQPPPAAAAPAQMTYEQLLATVQGSAPAAAAPAKPGFSPTGQPLQGHRFKFANGVTATFTCRSGDGNSFAVDGLGSVIVPLDAPIEYVGPPAAPATAPVPAPAKTPPSVKATVATPAPTAGTASATPAPVAPTPSKKLKIIEVQDGQTHAEALAADAARPPVEVIVAAPATPAAPRATVQVNKDVIVDGQVVGQAVESVPAINLEAPIAGEQYKKPVGKPRKDRLPDDVDVPRLYIGCAPQLGGKRLDDYVAGIKLMIEQEYGVADIRCAPARTPEGRDSPLAFGKWKGVVAVLVKTKPPQPGRYVVRSTDELTQVVVDTLIPMLRPEHVVVAL